MATVGHGRTRGHGRGRTRGDSESREDAWRTLAVRNSSWLSLRNACGSVTACRGSLSGPSGCKK